ncbi:MFS transporter [Nocardia sp. NPDC052566]|uniref:MFS transporter n=1 Tax=Nocardia sp. NPDC052566 TaxID=3364330 RepID=UPI0037C8CB79
MSATIPPPPTARRPVRLVIVGALLAMLLAMLDTAVVGTAMPRIVAQLGGLAQAAWVVIVYTLLFAVSTPVWGKLGDWWHRKSVFLTAIALFLTGSLLAGLAWSMAALIAFRALQGLGAGGIVVNASAIIGALVAPRERGRYQGMIASTMAIGIIGGPLLGGVISETLSWRWAFLVNIPLGLLAIAWTWWLLDLPSQRRPVRIDYWGSATLAVTVTALVLIVSWGGVEYPWLSPPILGAAAAAIAGLGAFLVVERRAREPVLPLRFFGSRTMVVTTLTALVVGVTMFSATLYLPLFQQTVQGLSAANSGLLLLPMMIPLVLVSHLTGKLMSATGRYKIFFVLGGLAGTSGAALLAMVDAHTGRPILALAMAMLGIGLGCTMQLTVTIAQNSVGLADIGAATGVTTLFRTMGGSVGLALSGALFAQAVRGHDRGEGASYLDSFATGIGRVFLVTTIICAIGFAISFLVEEIPLRTTNSAAPVKR